MAITRTPIIDDDGSNTTGTVLDNAWKQEFYDQIDGFVGVGAPTFGTFTPIDASGAGLVFTIGDQPRYAKVGSLVFFWLHIFYPSTASPAAAAIGGLPFLARLASAGAYYGYGVHKNWLISPGDTKMLCYDPAAGGQVGNATLSGANLVLGGFYFTD